VINYHKMVNPDLMEQLTVIHADANEYVGECDTLLIDHFEGDSSMNHPYIFRTVKELTENIKHETLWFWPLEQYILVLPFNSSNRNPYNRYLEYRKEYPTLPNLTFDELSAYCAVYNLGRNPGG